VTSEEMRNIIYASMSIDNRVMSITNILYKINLFMQNIIIEDQQTFQSYISISLIGYFTLVLSETSGIPPPIGSSIEEEGGSFNRFNHGG